MTDKQEQRIQGVTERFLSKITDALESVCQENRKVHGNFQWLMLKDIQELQLYCAAILDRKYARAEKLQANMDSGTREYIPNTLFDFLIEEEWK